MGAKAAGCDWSKPRAAACAMDQRMDPPALGEHLPDERCAIFLPGDVGRDARTLAARPAERLGSRCQAGSVTSGDRHASAGLDQRSRQVQAQPGGSSGDHGDFIGPIGHAGGANDEGIERRMTNGTGRFGHSDFVIRRSCRAISRQSRES